MRGGLLTVGGRSVRSENLVTEIESLPLGYALNVSLAPDSAAHRRVRPPPPPPSHDRRSAQLASGFNPQPAWNLIDAGGKTISDLVFVNCYVGTSGAWSAADMASIDGALSKTMSDANLQTVIQQYYPARPISSRMLPSVTHLAILGATAYKDTVEALVTELHAAGAIGGADAGSTVIDVLLPPGVVLSSDFSPGFVPPAASVQSHERRVGGVIKVGPNEAADSRHGLGGYHGSVQADGTTVYYAAGVYSEGANGIVVFDRPWKNVVATLCHELNEARTDADVEDVNRTGDQLKLGWYSQAGGGEIGDLPINEATDIHQVFREVPLADGSGTVPIQLMWSNKDGGPAAATA